MRKLLILALVGALFIGQALPVGAVTDGERTDEHSEVVLILMEVDGEPAFRCTGALMSPTIVLTAGHCAGAPGEFSGMRIFTEADVDNGDNLYPYGDSDPHPETGEEVEDSLNTIEVANWAAHPDYPFAPFFVNDVGVLELVEPYELDDYATLPGVDSLDPLMKRRGQKNRTFNAVGYGLQRVNPVFVQAERARYEASPRLIQINTPGFTGDFSLLLTNNHSTGGTCFGDSGGPNYLGNGEDLIVAGVTSFGLNGNCAGTGGVFRMDRENVQNFVNDFIATPYTPTP